MASNSSLDFTAFFNVPFSAGGWLATVGSILMSPLVSASDFQSGSTTSHTQVVPSTGGQATCITGLVPLNVTATNTKFKYAGPANNNELTEFLVENLQSGSTLATRITEGPYTATGSFNIFSKLCFPKSTAHNATTVQFLTHGGTLDHSYWDFAPGYSYVDAAAQAGYATFSYDRLGTGLSDHPDPIQIIQAGIQTQLAHQLIMFLREGMLGQAGFQKLVGVGHSIGSGLTLGVTGQYPKDFDALILTGISTSFAAVGIGIASTAQQIANTDPSGRFEGLPSGYITPAPIEQSVQFAFYRYPFYDQYIFKSQFQARQTNAIGESLTFGAVYAPVPAYTGPVDVINGENDWFYCGGDCNYPNNQVAAVQPAFLPDALTNGSESYLLPDAGHNLNLHLNAQEAFAHAQRFLAKNGIH